jgi:hypothetical protein
MAKYSTEYQTGGQDGPWRPDDDLEIIITSRKSVVPAGNAPPTGTQVSWASTAGNGSVTFFENGTRFAGSAEFPGEGPVGYRGYIK